MALDHTHGAVLGQVEVGTKTSEIPLFSTLLNRVDLRDAVVTADAMHAQRGHAGHLAGRGAHYVLTVKRNQPSLHAQLAALPWRQVPAAHDSRERGHGRDERRTIKATSVAGGLAVPSRRASCPDRTPPPGRQEEVVHRDQLRRHLPDRHPGQPRPNSPPSSAATGPSKTACTGSAT